MQPFGDGCFHPGQTARPVPLQPRMSHVLARPQGQPRWATDGVTGVVIGESETFRCHPMHSRIQLHARSILDDRSAQCKPIPEDAPHAPKSVERSRQVTSQPMGPVVGKPGRTDLCHLFAGGLSNGTKGKTSDGVRAASIMFANFVTMSGFDDAMLFDSPMSSAMLYNSISKFPLLIF